MAIKTKASATPTASPDWEEASSDFDRRVVFMDIIGETGTGRSTLALTAPGPIAYVHAAEKVEGLFKPQVDKGKRVRVHNFGGVFTGSPQDVVNAANPKWLKAQRMWAESCEWARTRVLDTGTEGWEMHRLANFGELKPKGRIDNMYGPVNAAWRSMFKDHKMQPDPGSFNTITIHQMKDEYKDVLSQGKVTSTRTGRLTRVGMKEMPYLAEVIIETSKDPMTGTFRATIRKGWFNAMSEGTVFENEDINFAFIMSIITETDPDDWR